MAKMLYIDDITPKTDNWRVKVFILQKSNVYTNETGKRLQKLLLQDEKGKKIEGVVWNTNIELLENNLTPFSTYIIGGTDVDRVKEDYNHNSPGQEYQWQLSRTTIIRVVKEHNQIIACPPVPCTPFAALRTHINSGAPVDIVAAVIEVKETRHVTVRSKLVPLRECTVIQNELKPVTITLWGDYGHKQGGELFRLRKELPIVLFKGLKASAFSGISLSTQHFSFVALEPDIAEVKALRTWVNNNIELIKKAGGAPMQNYLETVSNEIDTVGMTPLSKIQADSKIVHTEVSLAIANVDQKICYTVCPKCYGTQKAMPDELFNCTSCNQDFKALPRCKIVVQLSDLSATINATFFDKCTARLLDKSPEDLHKYDKQATTKLLLDIDEQLHRKNFIMEIRANKKNFNDKITRYTVLNWIEKQQALGSINEEGQMSSQTTVESGTTNLSDKGKHPSEIESTTQGSNNEDSNSSDSSSPQKKKLKIESKTSVM